MYGENIIESSHAKISKNIFILVHEDETDIGIEDISRFMNITKDSKFFNLKLMGIKWF